MLTMRSSTNHRYSRYGVTVSARMVLSKHNHANGDHNHANHAKDSTGKKRPVEMVRSTDREIQETGLPLLSPKGGCWHCLITKVCPSDGKVPLPPQAITPRDGWPNL